MFYGMGGWNALVIVGVMLLFALIVAAIVVPIVLVTRGQNPPDRTGPAPRSVEARLRELDDLRHRGVISPAEYETQRAAIIREL